MESTPAGPCDTGLVAISRSGVVLAGRLATGLPHYPRLHLVDRYADLIDGPVTAPVEVFPLPLRPVLEGLFGRYRQLVLFMPVGAAVRLLAPLLQNKGSDPAVVCVDDAGRYAVSLLSGHLGGADQLAEQVAEILGATPVITSASHVKGTLAVDLLGREFGWRIEASSGAITRTSAAVVNGEPVGVLQEAGEPNWWPEGEPLPPNVKVFDSLEDLVASNCHAALVISDRGSVAARFGEMSSGSVPLVVYHPRSLAIGMGCRRGVARSHLEEFLRKTLSRHDLAVGSIRCIATAEVKKDEAGLLELAQGLEAPLVCYDGDQLNSVFAAEFSAYLGGSGGEPTETGKEALNRSEAAHRLLGVWGVAEPAALLASGSRRLLVARQKTDRATIAVARVQFS